MTTVVPLTLDVEDLCAGYDPNRPVLRGIRFVARSGELICLLGRNGSGKTTLLRCILGLVRPWRGAIRVQGRLLNSYSGRSLACRVAYVPQATTPAFAFTSLEVVLMGRLPHMGPLGLPSASDVAVAREAMRMTHTVAFADRPFSSLSGGEAQCVMIARALAQQPDLMLLDEPTSHLDLANQLHIYDMLRRVAHQWPMTVLCISHDVNLAARFADRLLLLRQGRILADGPPTEALQISVLEHTFDVRVQLIPGPSGTPLVWAGAVRTLNEPDSSPASRLSP